MGYITKPYRRGQRGSQGADRVIDIPDFGGPIKRLPRLLRYAIPILGVAVTATEIAHDIWEAQQQGWHNDLFTWLDHGPWTMTAFCPQTRATAGDYARYSGMPDSFICLGGQYFSKDDLWPPSLIQNGDLTLQRMRTYDTLIPMPGSRGYVKEIWRRPAAKSTDGPAPNTVKAAFLPPDFAPAKSWQDRLPAFPAFYGAQAPPSPLTRLRTISWPVRLNWQRELKVRASSGALALYRAVSRVFGAFTEGMDFVNALYYSLPAHRRSRYDSWADRIQKVYDHFGEIDAGLALFKLILNEMQDRLYGALGEKLAALSIDLNSPVGLQHQVGILKRFFDSYYEEIVTQLDGNPFND